MRHRVAGRKFGLPSDQRMALLKGLVRALIEHDAIFTTECRAKEVAPMAEKLVTLGKTNTIHARRLARRVVNDEDLVKRLFDEIAPRFRDTQGGYTRIIRVGRRRGDAAPVAKLEFTSQSLG